MNTFSSRKATGTNIIPSDILHVLKKDTSYPLSKIFNPSLSTGVYPDILIPIFKKGCHLTTINYRPISLLSNLNKILEKLGFNRVYTFLNKYKCIYDLQFGFRKKTFHKPCTTRNYREHMKGTGQWQICMWCIY